jgi:hypothetical protein
MSIKLVVATVLLGITGAGAAFAWQGHSHEQQGGKAAQITGLVVDIACFVGHDSSGPKHAKCAEACARAGNPLAIYDEATKTLYLPISLDHKNPNTKLMKYIETKVKVTGAIMEKAGLKGIAIEKVETVNSC